MIETKFTPGPWEISSEWTDTGSHYTCISADNAIDDIVGEHGVMGTANTHLIAAAPDMYALIETISNREGLWSMNDLQVALAKARGE